MCYASKSVTEYSIQYDLPNYYGAPNGTTCASIAGTVVLGYYDRFYEDLIPDFQVYTRLGTRIKYKSLSDVILNLSNELYNLMGGEREHLGTTYSEFQDGMATYVASKGHSYTTESVFLWGEFDFNKYKAAVESKKPVVLFLSSFAIKENIVPTLTEEQLKYVYADEADLLNVALFGKTAAQWRRENPTLKGNIRDYATIEQLLVIANMESYNAILIEQNVSQSDRLKQLNAMAISQLRVLQQSNSRLLSEGRKD